MTIVPLTIPSGSNPAKSKQGGAQELINCYREDLGSEAKTGYAAYGRDGLGLFCTLSDANGGIRALKDVDGTLYVVAGTKLYTVTAGGTGSLVGTMTLLPTTGIVYMDRNRRSPPDVMIACGGVAYYCRSGSLAQITDSDFLAPTAGMAFNNGYFVVGADNAQFQSSNLDDASNWAALAFGRADAGPDAIVTLSTLQQDLLVFGGNTTEVQRDVGDSPFPYERVTVIEFGCKAPGSVATINGTTAFVAHDNTVRMLDGYDAVRISTHSQERDIEALTDYSTLTATAWTAHGHTFYKISCPSFTWVYDSLTGKWARYQTYGRANWNISYVELSNGHLIAGDATSGVLYIMSDAYSDDAGTPIISKVIYAPVHAYPYPITIDEIFFDVETGVGTGSGNAQDIDPQLMVEVSRDGGNTFSIRRYLSLGQQGKRLTRVKAQQFGQFGQDGATIAISWSAKVRRALYQGAADITRDAA